MSMSKILGLVLIVVGAALLFQGINRKQSLLGDAAEIGAKVANKVDGGARVPRHLVYIAGGVVLVLGGAGLVLRKAG